ncbi:MAG: SpoIID/LytB domain-containing protein [Gemmatimonadetes bacterium]|nr:SpoIID/LytB domain-containing protein [Gemmatimonadota bacterium]
MSGWRTRWQRLAAVSALGAAVGACARPKPERPTRQPELRVGLATGAPQVTVGGAGRLTAFAEGAAALQIDNQPVTVSADGRAVVVGGSTPGRYQRLLLVSPDPGGVVGVNGRRYRGTVELLAQGGGVSAVNRLGVEDYLLGVVSAEMGRRSSREAPALAAQAVVSRTYALRNRGRFASQGFDLEAGVTDQAYGGVDAETPEGSAAVRATTGLVLTSRGQLITAFFHSTCGYATATPGEAFRGVADLSYLRSVSDRRPGSGGGYYCDISPRFRWTVEWDQVMLRDILRRNVSRVLGVSADIVDDIRDVRVAHRGRSGRATEVRIRVGQGEIPVYAPDIRTVFMAPDGRPLGSTAVQLHPERDGDRLVRLKVAGAGWGHGVGMCQWGAVGRARAGQDFRQIVAAYFPGTEVERWY